MERVEKRKALLNPEDKGADVIDYEISEAVLDDNGDVIIDTRTGQWKTTGITKKWTILKGEKAIFPYYVADYLKSIYPFLRGLAGNYDITTKVDEGDSLNEDNSN